MSEPLMFQWNGEAMEIDPRYAKRADDEFVIGYRYLMEAYTPEEQRSRTQHAYFFATVMEYWRNLPEHLASQPWATSANFMRHKALIETGWHHPETFYAKSQAEAERWAGQLPRAINEDGDPVWTEISIEATVILRRWPRSQKVRRMKKAEFQKSCDDVLAFLKNLVGAEVSGFAA